MRVTEIYTQLPSLIKLVREAGKAIMKVYEGSDADFQIQAKEDHSPLTLADQKAQDVIAAGLGSLFPDIPIISEEGSSIPFQYRKDWTAFWLVDPLDGTKEFIKRNGEFTVNIALMENNEPVWGIIGIPAKDWVYVHDAQHCYRIDEHGTQTMIHVGHKKSSRVAVGSRSHGDPEEKKVLDSLDVTSFVSAGSSLKFCMVAEGSADVYYRANPTMEWDTAAGHALILAAGGQVKGLIYNKENLTNSSFCCLGF